ncbi:MAG: ATPase, T2SS/T4P/T4SS family [Alphaproteobacteria bacterium]
MLSDLADRTRKLINKAPEASKPAPKSGELTAPAKGAVAPPSPPPEAPPSPDQAPSAQGKAASSGADNAAKTAIAAQQQIKIVDERSMALSGALKFTGLVLTVEGSTLKITAESRNFCALFDNGMWLVSAAHRNSPLVTSVALQARRQGYKVDEPHYVTPNIVQQAYAYAERQAAMVRLDDNAVRRKIVEMIQQAADMGANDIHIEAAGGRAKVEFRVDGALRLWETWTQREGEQVLSAVYSHSIGQSGATANWLEPQAAMLAGTGGQESVQLPIGVPSMRCQWVPLSDGGRYLNMRLQYDSAHLFGENFAMADVDSIGFSQEQLKTVRFLRSLPGGMRIFSGPVNQGKTTTLRVMLNRRMVETNFDRKCYLIEDPPEGGVMGASQIGVSASVKEEQREKSFSEVMRSALRLDPDIVMLGEIRDIQTAKFAFRLALSGRQIYTTLHVYSAIAVPRRLLDLGIEPYLIYDPHLLCGMFCQRLLKGLCPSCRVPIKEAPKQFGPDYEDLARRVRTGLALMIARRMKADPGQPALDRIEEPDMSQIYVANPDGCPKCFKGRSGRTVCAEVAETDIKLMNLLQEGKIIEAEEYWLSPHGLNGITMAWHALEKIRRGEVSPADAEVEVGPLAREREIAEVEQRLGVWR